MEAPETKRCEGQTVISMEHHGSHDEIGQVYHELHEWARQHNVKVKGSGLTSFLSPPEKADPRSGVFEVCLPVPSAPEGDTKVTVKELPACTVAYVTVEGPYAEIPGHYTELLAWLQVQGREIAGPPREVYVKRLDARGGADPGECVTEIQFPIRE